MILTIISATNLVRLYFVFPRDQFIHLILSYRGWTTDIGPTSVKHDGCTHAGFWEFEDEGGAGGGRPWTVFRKSLEARNPIASMVVFNVQLSLSVCQKETHFKLIKMIYTNVWTSLPGVSWHCPHTSSSVILWVPGHAWISIGVPENLSSNMPTLIRENVLTIL